MNINRSFTRVATCSSALVAVLFVASGGCDTERHLVGDSPDAGSTGTNDGGGSGASRGSGGSGGGLEDGGGGGSGGVAVGSGGAYQGTVVSLGDKGSLGWALAIPPEEVARRLSMLMLNHPPSTALTAAVVAKAPRTNEDVGELADGLLLEETSALGRAAFYRWWLQLDMFTVASRDMVVFPALTADVRTALVNMTLTFAEDVTWQPQGDLSTLLTQPVAFVTPATAPWFPGVTAAAATSPTRVKLDGTRFAGIITQPAVLTTPDQVVRTYPTGRGFNVRTRYLCQAIPGSTESAVQAPAIMPGSTIRSWVESNVTNANCAVCHQLIDQPGFAFGHFDAVGAYNETENGLAVDTTGSLRSTSAGDLPFTGAPGLATRLAQLPEVRACYARQWLNFADSLFSVTPGPQVDVDVDYIVRRATVAGELNLRGTIRAVTETHTFLDPR